MCQIALDPFDGQQLHNGRALAYPITKSNIDKNISRQMRRIDFLFLSLKSLIASSQYSGQSNASCGANSVGYSPWGPGPSQHQFVENFYNNPVQYPSSSVGSVSSAGPLHRFQITPTGQTPCYPPNQNGKNCHPHFPPNHALSADYQAFHLNARKCSTAR